MRAGRSCRRCTTTAESPGGTMDRPALKRLLADIARGAVDTVVVYKVDRLTRSLADFAKIVEVFETNGVTFVSVTQSFNTTTSMGRLTLNMLLSFAQFEREVAGERIRDKIAASKRKGMWMGGLPPLGYDVADRKLVDQRRRGRNGSPHLPALCIPRLGPGASGRAGGCRYRQQASDRPVRPRDGRQAVFPRSALPDAAEPDLPWPDRPSSRTAMPASTRRSSMSDSGARSRPDCRSTGWIGRPAPGPSSPACSSAWSMTRRASE